MPRRVERERSHEHRTTLQLVSGRQLLLRHLEHTRRIVGRLASAWIGGKGCGG